MVRKRSYKQVSDDSDSDYDPEFNDAEPKKYSLRKRTRQTLVEDFDYEVDDSDLSGRQSSGDDDYELEAGNAQIESFSNYIQPQVAEASYNSEVDNGLIDFEDIIRADIVINKNRIDYDKVIDKTKITVEKKRGRPRKSKPAIEDFGHSILGPLAEVNFLAPGEDADILEPLTQVESVLESPPHTENLESTLQDEPTIQPTSLNRSIPESITHEHTAYGGADSAGVKNGFESAERTSGSDENTPEDTDETTDMDKDSQIENYQTQEASCIEPKPEEPCEEDIDGLNSNEVAVEKNTPEVNAVNDSVTIKDASDDVIIISDKPDVIILDDE